MLKSFLNIFNWWKIMKLKIKSLHICYNVWKKEGSTGTEKLFVHPQAKIYNVS